MSLISQNHLIRQIVGLNKYCLMTNIRKCLNILDIDHLYISAKLSFINSIKNNEISQNILNHIIANMNRYSKNSKSFCSDLKLLINFFNLDLNIIIYDPMRLRQTITEECSHIANGISESINICLSNYRNLYYHNLLKLLT